MHEAASAKEASGSKAPTQCTRAHQTHRSGYRRAQARGAGADNPRGAVQGARGEGCVTDNESGGGRKKKKKNVLFEYETMCKNSVKKSKLKLYFDVKYKSVRCRKKRHLCPAIL